MKLKRVFITCLLVSVAGGALVGIVGMFADSWRIQSQLIGTMMSIGLCSLTALGTAIVLEKQPGARRAMIVSGVASGACLLALLTVTWIERSFDYGTRQVLRRIAGQMSALAVALPLAGLLSLTRFGSAGLNLVRIGSITIVFIAAGTISIAIWTDPGSDYFRAIATVLILTVLCVIGLPLLHKLAGLPPPSQTVSSKVRLSIVCPRCERAQTVPAGTSRCERCKLRFLIEVEEPRCPKCAYLLYQLTEPRCPECGTALPPDEVTLFTFPASPGQTHVHGSD